MKTDICAVWNPFFPDAAIFPQFLLSNRTLWVMERLSISCNSLENRLFLRQEAIRNPQFSEFLFRSLSRACFALLIRCFLIGSSLFQFGSSLCPAKPLSTPAFATAPISPSAVPPPQLLRQHVRVRRRAKLPSFVILCWALLAHFRAQSCSRIRAQSDN